MVLVDPAQKLLVGTVAERSVGAHLAIAKLEITGLVYVEAHGPASSNNPLALSITEGGVLSVTAAAPVVCLSTVKVDVSREDTSESGHRGRAVLSFFIGARFIKSNGLLAREVSHIVH